MPVPPDPILRAASIWLELLRTSDADRVRVLLRSHPEFARFTPTQYEVAYEWLRANQLIERARHIDVENIPTVLFGAAIGQALWIIDADVLITDSSELPSDAVDAANVLGINSPRAVAIVREICGKVNTEYRSRIGLAGELAFVAMLRGSVNGVIDHVAATSDGYGYDIAVQAIEVEVHIELKSTTRSARTKVFISRNEFEVGREDQSWALVVARLDPDERVVGVWTIERKWLYEHSPVDKSGFGRWQSASLDVPESALRRGVPSLVPLLKPDCHQLLKP